MTKKMKNLLIILSWFGVLGTSCSNSSGASSGSDDKKTEPASASSSDPSPKGYGTFTFTMMGKQRVFTTWHSFMLFSMDSSAKTLMLEDGGPGGAGFDFRLNKTGETKFEAGYANVLNQKLLFAFFDTTGVSYIGDDMVVNVSSLSADKLTGTFTGKLVKEKYQIKDNNSADIPKVIEVTDGKFNLYKQQQN